MKHNRNKTMSAEIKQNNLLNSPTPNQYSILGGVVAPKSSAYTIQGMPNPLTERPTKVLDTSSPSLRDNTATSRFNDFNPYNNDRADTIVPLGASPPLVELFAIVCVAPI